MLKCIINVSLFLCPQSVRTSDGHVYNLHTFNPLDVFQRFRLHSCPMLTSELFSAHTSIDDLRFGWASAYWGPTTRRIRACDRNETVGGKNDKVEVYDMSSLIKKINVFTINGQSWSTRTLLLCGQKECPTQEKKYKWHPDQDLPLVSCADLQRWHAVIQWICK